MKCALIGCGRIAVNHIKAIKSNHLELTALCDLNLRQIRKLLQNTDIKEAVPHYTDYKIMINEHPDLDIAAIATDSGSHAEIALYCIRKGIHVIIEKPMAMNMDDANELIRQSEARKVKLMVCFQNRFNKAVQEMKKALKASRMGKISHGTVSICLNRSKAYYDQASWRGKWQTDGGALMNQGIHGIDLLCWITEDDIDTIYGVTRRRFHPYMECEDIGMAIVQFKNGIIGSIEGTVNVYPENLESTLTLFGEKGTVKLGGKSYNHIEIWNFEREETQDYEIRNIQEIGANIYGNGHVHLYADMIDAIQKDRKPYIDGYAGRKALEVVLAVYKSQFTGRPVKLPLRHFSTLELKGLFGGIDKDDTVPVKNDDFTNSEDPGNDEH